MPHQLYMSKPLNKSCGNGTSEFLKSVFKVTPVDQRQNCTLNYLT